MKRIVSEKELKLVSEILDVSEDFIEEVLYLRDELHDDGNREMSEVILYFNW